MTGRILRIELRRSNARWMVLLLLPAAITFGQAGRGLTVAALDHRQVLLGALPLAMGVAAWHARRDRRSRMDELLSTTARPRWRRVLPAVTALAIGALAGYLAAVAVNVGLVVAADGYLSVVALPIIAVGALVLLVGVSFGLALGRWLPFVLIPPLLVVYLAVTAFLGDTEAYTEGPEATFVAPGWMLLWGDLQALGTEFDFAAVTAGTHLGQGLWAAVLAAAGLVVFATARLRTLIIAVVLVVLGAVAAVAVLPERYADAFYLDPGATALVCTADTPRVCVMRAHRAALADLRGPGREALAVLAGKLPDAPTSVVEMPYGDPPPPRADTIPIALLVSGDGRNIQPATGTAPDIRWELLLGAGTPGCANAPAVGSAERRRYDIARLVAAAWLLDQEPPAPADPSDPALLQQGETLPAYQALRGLPPDEQRARVAELRRAELACDSSDRLDLLTGPR
jgi:hypothetical protein